MRLKLAILPLALAAAAIQIGSAAAGDLKRTPVPAYAVPAPIPTPEYHPRWYFRADVGIGLATEPDITVGGPAFLGSTAGTTVPIGSSWFNKDFDTFTTWTVGVGHVWSPSWRSDLTVDVRSRAYTKSNVDFGYDAAGGVGQSGTFQDSTRISSLVTLFNTYFDFQRFHSFTPYIGAGLGFSTTQTERNNTTTQSDGSSSTASSNNTDITLAAAAMVGVTYNFDPVMAMDLGYRYLYIGGSEAAITVLGRSNVISFGDIHEHQLRAGLRFNVN